MQTAAAALTRAPVPSAPTREVPLLLIVDADARARAACAAALTLEGYRTIEARTVLETLVKACWHRPSLVLLGLPLDGAGVAGEDTVYLLAGCPDTTAIPVLPLSDPGITLAEVRRRLRNAPHATSSG